MAIEQHPIPQDVAGYKFRLIGDMTLKQFIWLAGGIILGLVVYSLPLPFFFKYPLAAIGVLLGAGIAFVPVEGRPMDKWLIAFIRSIYSPTQYVWSKPDEDQTTPVTTTPTEPAKTKPNVVIQPVVVTDSHSPVQRDEDLSVVPSEAERTKGASPVVAPPPVATTPIEPLPQPSLPVTPPIVAPSENVPQKPITPVAPSATPTAQLPIPFTPTSGNTLVGMTLTPDGKILDGCLIEITANGLSLRATKSNQLGQFLFAKPLENGVYQIITEKAGYQFDTYSLNLTGQIVKPLRLQAIGQS